jgi:uncharacterized protein
MSAAVPIHKGQDFYVPAFEVWRLDKRRSLPASVVRDVTQISYTDSLDRIDSYTLTLNNWDAERLALTEPLALKYSDSDEFLPGVELEIFMGYFGRDPLRRMISGPITSAQPSFPASGQPTLEIDGENLLRTLQNDKRSVAYRRMTDSEIARAVGDRLGIAVKTDPDAEAAEERYGYILQDNRPSILFLLERAHRIGYDLYVEEQPPERLLYFGPSLGVRRVTYRLTYGRSLVDFRPTLDTSDQVGEVTVRSWDNVNKRLIEHTARRRDLRTRGVGEAGEQERIERSFRQTREVLTSCPVQTPQEARTVATEALERNAKEMLTATGSTVGLPDLRAGSVVHIDGVGARYSGRYFVTGTTHGIGEGGYTTQFRCRREEI